MMAVRLPELAAAVPFYGAQPSKELVPQIKAPLLCIMPDSIPMSMRDGLPMKAL